MNCEKCNKKLSWGNRDYGFNFPDFLIGYMVGVLFYGIGVYILS